VIVSGRQNESQNYYIHTANISFESVAELWYLGTALINQNRAREWINVRSNSTSVCCYSVQNRMSLHLQSKAMKIKAEGTATAFCPLFRMGWAWHFASNFNLLTPDVNYSGRTAPLTSKVAFYIFIQQI